MGPKVGCTFTCSLSKLSSVLRPFYSLRNTGAVGRCQTGWYQYQNTAKSLPMLAVQEWHCGWPPFVNHHAHTLEFRRPHPARWSFIAWTSRDLSSGSRVCLNRRTKTLRMGAPKARPGRSARSVVYTNHQERQESSGPLVDWKESLCGGVQHATKGERRNDAELCSRSQQPTLCPPGRPVKRIFASDSCGKSNPKPAPLHPYFTNQCNKLIALRFHCFMIGNTVEMQTNKPLRVRIRPRTGCNLLFCRSVAFATLRSCVWVVRG